MKRLKDEEKIKVSTLLYGLAIVAIFLIAVASVLAYGTQTEIGGKIAKKISAVVPFPAAIVDWRHIVFAGDVKANLASVERFYQTQNFASEGLRIDFSTENGKKRLKIKEKELLDKMVEDEIIQILAKEEGIEISEKDAQQELDKKLNEFGTTEEVKADLEKSYGWDMNDFKKRVVLPGLYADALAKKILEKNVDNAKEKEKINKAQAELKNGKDFVEVVRMYSEGSSRENGGDLGWAKKDQVALELQEPLFGEVPYEKNSIIESVVGFHIIEIKNKKKENNQDALELRQIFVAKLTFADWLIGEKKKMNVWVPLAGFTWDKENGGIDFADENMRTFEKEERKKAQGDASIMF